MQLSSKEKTTVLVTASTFPRSATDYAPRFILNLCIAIEAHGPFRCIVLAPHESGAQESEIMDGIQIIRYRYFYPASLELISGLGMIDKIRRNSWTLFLVPFFLFGQWLATIRVARRYNASVIMGHWITPQGWVASFARLFLPGRKVIWTALGGDIRFIQTNRFLQKMTAWISRGVDGLVYTSHFSEEDLKAKSPVRPKRTAFISMGYDENFEEVRRRRLQRTYTSKDPILCIGRLEENKGVFFLMRSMQRVVQECPEAVLRFVGDGPQREPLRQLAKELGISDHVILTGGVPRADVPRYFEDAQFLVMPSMCAEGLTTVLVEAAGAGVPIVSSKAGGAVDLIEDHVTGLMVPMGDEVQMARAMIEFFRDSALRLQLAEKAYEAARRNHTRKAVAMKYIELISQTLNGSHPT